MTLHPAETITRKYVLTKIAAGDYVLPSNDGKTLWRIAKYTEGPSSGITDWPRDKEVWGVWRWEKQISVGAYLDTEDWTRWPLSSGPHFSRAEAIQAALRAGEQS